MSVDFTISGSGSGAVKAVEAFQKKLQEIDKDAEAAAKATRGIEKEALRLAEKADPVAKFNRKLEELSEWAKKDEKNVALAQKAVAQLGKELDDATGVTAKMVAEQKALADAQKKAADEAEREQARLKQLGEALRRDVETPIEKYKRNLADVQKLLKAGAIDQDVFNRKLRGLKDEFQTSLIAPIEKAEEAQDKSFGAMAVERLAAYGAGIVSVGGFVGVLTRALNDAEAAAQAAADRVLDALGAIGEAQQLGPDSQPRVVAMARRLQQLGVTDLTRGVDVGTNLENAGLSQSESQFFVEKLLGTRLVKPENATAIATAIQDFRAQFPDAGSFEDVAQKVLKVSTIPGVSPGMSGTLEQVLKFSSYFDRLGGESALAAYAAVEQTVSPTQAAEALKSFGTQAKKRGLWKESLPETIVAIRNRVSAGENPFDILGEGNAVQAYDLLNKQLGSLSRFEGIIGASSTAVAETSGLMNKDPVVRAANTRALAQGRLAATLDELSQPESLLAAAIADIKRGARGSAIGGLATSPYSLMDAAGLENNALRLIMANSTQASKLSQETRSDIEDYLRRTAEAAEETARRTRSKVTTRAGN